MILYTLAVSYLTGCLIVSTMCVTAENDDGEMQPATMKDKFMAGVMWPVFIYRMVKGDYE